MNKYTIIIQARLSSKRFPKKILNKLGALSVIEYLIDRIKTININKTIWVATTNKKSDDVLAEKLCKKVKIFRGSEDDVLGRYFFLAKKIKAKHIIRITSDCPFVDKKIIEKGIKIYESGKYDYVSNILKRTYPDGLDVEIFSFTTLEKAHFNCKNKQMREHVTPYMRTGYYKKLKTGNFKVCNFLNDTDLSHIRWTLDTKDDLIYLQSIAKKLKHNFYWMDAISLLTKDKHILQRNKHNYKRIESLKNIQNYANKLKKYKKSNQIFKKAIQIIPLASQTFSKSYIQFPRGAAPLFAKNGQGAIIKDVDDNNYIDFIMGLLPIVLGYNDVDVNSSIVEQLNKGITFSLASDLEYELASLLCRVIPSADMVRFGKNGSDVNTAAIRLARAHTKREKIIVCGYHGWHDWYIGTTTRDEGVPNIIKELTYKVSLNDLNKLYDLLKTEHFAAVILEPANQTDITFETLKSVREMTKKFGTLLIFDEIISGFRIDVGGAQTYYNIVPDISTFGKAMANGMPLSAIVGKKNIFKKMKEIFFSATFGGEALSLAASIATINKIQKQDVIKKIKITGKTFINDLNLVLSKNNLINYMHFSGPDWWPRLIIKSKKINTNLYKTILRQENIQNGLLLNSSLNLSFSHHDNSIINKTKDRFNASMISFNKIISSKNPKKYLKGKIIVPTFKVR